MKKNTFTCFEDIKTVNRDSLFNKLLQAGFTDKLDWSLKSLYSSTLSAVQVNDHITDGLV